MRIRYILKLMLDDIFQKKIMIILLLAMSSISIYMTDVIATRYFSNQYRINSMSSMFAVNPDKVNYATYGDKVSHLHVHVVPKYENGPDWGGPFKDDRTPVILSEEEYIRRVEQIREHLT